MSKSIILSVVSCGILIFLALLANEASAATINPVISPLQSVLNATMTFNGSTATSQTTGSLSDGYSGSINADLTNNMLTFTGGSNIVAEAAPTGYQPPIGGANTEGSPQNYGAYFSNLTVVIYSFSSDFDVRGLDLDITGGSAAIGEPANGLVLTIENGATNFSVMNLQALGVANGYYSENLATSGSNVATNLSTIPVTLTQMGSIDTLTIPVNVTYHVTEEGLPATIQFQGNLVSTYAVPEPSTLALLGVGALGLLASTWRRRKRKMFGKTMTTMIFVCVASSTSFQVQAGPMLFNAVNWAGYAVEGSPETSNSVSAVSGSWIVPTAAASQNPAANSSSTPQCEVWVGMDGFGLNNNTVEQIGTDSDYSHGATTY